MGLPHVASNRRHIAAAGILVFALGFIDSRPGYADVYRYVDGHGQVHFSDRQLGRDYQAIGERPDDTLLANRAGAKGRFDTFTFDRAGNSQPELTLTRIAVTAVGNHPEYTKIYRYVDRHGHVHFSDRRLEQDYPAIGERAADALPANQKRAKRQFNTLIFNTAQTYQLDPALVHAVITAESAYDPNAISKAGAVGLMQLMPATARRYGVQDRRDPADNLRGGVRYLHYLLNRFNSLSLAIAAYNAGENAVVKYGHQIPPFPETQTYVRRVLKYYRTYQLAS